MLEAQSAVLIPTRRPEPIFWQMVFSLLVAATSGILLYYLWDHLGLPLKAQPQWGWPESTSQGLRYFVAVGLPLAAWLPTAALGLVVHLTRPWQNPGVLQACRRSLTLDAATYLLLPAIVLLPVLWRELGNGLAAQGFAYLALWSAKAVLLAWVMGSILLRMENVTPRVWGGLTVGVWALIFVPGLWIAQASPILPSETAFLQGSLALLPDWLMKHEAQVGGVNLMFGVVLAPFALVGDRLGGILLSSACGAAVFSLLVHWLWRSRRQLSPLCTTLILASAPVAAVFWRVAPEAPAMLLLILGVWGLKRPGLTPLCALHLVILDRVYSPVAITLLAWGLFEAWRYGWSRMSLHRRILILTALTGLAAAHIWNGHANPVQISFGLELRRLLLVAPVWLLVFAGIPLSLRIWPLESLQLLSFPAVILLHALAAAHLGLKWDLQRAFLICLPLMVWFMATSVQALAAPWRRLAAALPAALTLGYSWLAVLLHHMKPAGDAKEVLLPSLGSALGLEIAYALPQGSNPTPNLAWAALWSAAVVWMGWKVWRHREIQPADSWSFFTALEANALALGLALLTTALLISCTITW